MKVVQINAVCGQGSTGKICASLSKRLTADGVQNHVFYALGNSKCPNSRRYANKAYVKVQAIKARVLGNWGFNSCLATKRLIARLEQIQPDIVHLHNVHSHDCNLTMLLKYLSRKKMKVVWTFHDCWMFTGYCVYFTMADCQRWQHGCGKCPQKKAYSCFFDRSRRMLERKKNLLAGLDVTIVAPSMWMADLVKRSVLQKCDTRVIPNGIDRSVFTPRTSDFRARYGVSDKHIVLGVAFDWDQRKGLDVFCALATRLSERYQIVLVGVNDQTRRQLPQSIISIHRTHDQQELAAIYTAADVFVNPTREDNYPTVNMEALVCGTPVITFRTGGSPEIADVTCGAVVDVDDITGLQREIERICTTHPYSKPACLERAKSFDEQERNKEYVTLYKELYDRSARERT